METYQINIGSHPWSLEWNHDGQILGCVTKDKRIFLIDPREKDKGLCNKSYMDHIKSLKMKWLGDSGQFVILSSNGNNSGRNIKIFDIRQMSTGPILERKLDNHNYNADIHYDDNFKLLFVVNRRQTFCQYF